MSWVQTVVESLAESKRLSIPFDAAWNLAIHRHRPRLHELGVNRAHQDDLFDQSGAQAVEWFRGICESAYNDAPAPDGSPSRMRGLRAALEDGFAYQEVPRVRPSQRGAAAA